MDRAPSDGPQHHDVVVVSKSRPAAPGWKSLTLRKLLRLMGLNTWDSLAWTHRLQGVFVAAVIIILVLVLGMMLAGCAARSLVAGGESSLTTTTTTNPGSTTTTVAERVEITPEGKPAAITTTTTTTVVPPSVSEKTEARAVAGRSEIVGQDVKQSANIAPPKVEAPNGTRASGGKNETDSEGKGDQGRSLYIIASIIGGVLAAFCAWRRWFSAMFACIGFAACCYMAGMQPQLTTFIILAGGAVLVAYVLYLNREKLIYRKNSELLVKSIDSAPPEAKQAVKAQVAARGEKQDFRIIDGIKRRLGPTNHTTKAGDNPA